MRCQWIFGLVTIASILSGCTAKPDFDAVYSRVSSATIQAGQAIPAPRGEIILSVTGKINARQASASLNPEPGDRVVMDRTSLEAVGVVEYDVKDPFESKSSRFRGVLMRDLLNQWQVSPEASQVTFIALNDYHITIPIQLLRQYPVLLALEQDGVVMQPDYRGPAMIVMPHEQYRSVRELAEKNYWIWQVTQIQIE